MKRRLITGEYQPHLENALLEEVRYLKSIDPLTPVCVIVPTNALGRHLSIFLASAMGGHAEIRFLTLLDLSRRLAEGALSAEGLSPMPPLADLLLLKESVEEGLVGHDSYFGRVSGTDGFLRVLLAAIGDLREGCLTPADLGGAVKKASLSKVAAGKVGEVVRLWRTYEGKKAAAKLYDRSDLMAKAATMVAGDAWIQGLPEIFFYGFYDLNPLQRRMVFECSAVRDAVFFFPFVDNLDFDYARPTLRWLADIGFGVEGGGGAGSGDGRGGEAVCDARIDAPPGAGGPAPFERTELSILSTAGEERECREIVREILKLGGLGAGDRAGVAVKNDAAREGSRETGAGTMGGSAEGLRLNEIGIILRDPSKYAGLFARTLEGLGVEPYAGEGLPLSGGRAGRSLSLFLELIESNFARREVMDFLTFAELDFGERASDSQDTALWDLLSKEAGILVGVGDWRRKLSAMSSRGWSPRCAGVNEDGLEGGETSDAPKKLLEAVERLYGGVSKVRAKGKPSSLAEDLCEAFRSVVAPGEERDLVSDTVHSLASLDSCVGAMDRSSFFWLVRRQLESTQIRSGSLRGRGPVVAGLMTSRGLPFKVVVIPGLVEGSFPAPPRQDPILLDGERAALNAAFEMMGLDGGLALKAERSKEEKLLFTLAGGSASQRVLLSYSRIDPLTGSERLPSEYLLDAAGSASGKKCDLSDLDRSPFYKRVPLDRLYPEDGSYLDRAELDLMAAAAAVAGDEGALEYLKAGAGFVGHSLEAENSRWGQSRFTVYDGVIESQEALELLKEKYAGSKGVVFPTSLECYAGCPFKYFMSNILGIESIEAPEDVLSMAPADRGRLAHFILEKLFAQIFEGGGLPARGWEKALTTIAEKVLRGFRSDNPFGLPLLWEVDESRLVDDLHESVAQDLSELGGFVPWRLELRFGYGRGTAGGPGGRVELPIEEGRVILLGGKIDRVDLDEGRREARVIDYKTGKGTGFKENKLGGGTTLQLPLYILGAQQLLGDEMKVVDAQYYLVSGGNKGGRIHFSAHALNERMADLLSAVGTIVRGIESGVFFAYPGDPCRFCDYLSACGPGRDVFERKSSDPRAQDFLRMKELE